MNFTNLRNLEDAFKASRTLQTAVHLKIFDVVASEARYAEGISSTLGLNERATELLCNALTGMGLLEKQNGKFVNTETSQRYLVTSSPLYYGWIIEHNYNMWETWSRLDESIKTGKNPSGADHKEYTKAEHEAFIMGMHSIVTARGDIELLRDKLGLENVRTFLDLGGGPGSFSIGFCARHRGLRATVFDLPETLEHTRKVIARYPELDGRVQTIAGDFLADELPKKFDVVFVSNIIHSYNEEENQRLMAKICASLNDDGRVIIKDHVMNEDLTRPVDGAIFALHMLLNTTGRDYSATEISAWLTGAGFTRTDQLELPSETSYGIIIGYK